MSRAPGAYALARPLQRFVALGTAAAALALVRIPGRPHTVCLLRATTGLPCPLCGGTTAAVDVGRGRFLGALAANPVVVVCAALLVLAATRRGEILVRHWRSLPDRSRLIIGGGVLVVSECWQLTRFGLI